MQTQIEDSIDVIMEKARSNVMQNLLKGGQTELVVQSMKEPKVNKFHM